MTDVCMHNDGGVCRGLFRARDPACPVEVCRLLHRARDQLDEVNDDDSLVMEQCWPLSCSPPSPTSDPPPQAWPWTHTFAWADNRPVHGLYQIMEVFSAAIPGTQTPPISNELWGWKGETVIMFQLVQFLQLQDFPHILLSSLQLARDCLWMIQ